MGEFADMQLDGTACESCGTLLGGEPTGFPTYCSAQCAEDAGFFVPEPRPAKPKRQPPVRPGSDKTLCPDCGKKVKRHGLPDHRRDAHGKVTS